MIYCIVLLHCAVAAALLATARPRRQARKRTGMRLYHPILLRPLLHDLPQRRRPNPSADQQTPAHTNIGEFQ